MPPIKASIYCGIYTEADIGIFIRNAATEGKVRELAALTGESLTAAIDAAVAAKLAEAQKAQAMKRRPTFDEIMAATDEFRKAVGLDKVKLNVTKADFDALWEIPGFVPDESFLEDDPK